MNCKDNTWTRIDVKDVTDSDGLVTDYALYQNQNGTEFICMFGDIDIYEPDPDYADAVFDDIEEAYEWFENYESYDVPVAELLHNLES